jgi:propanediol utilization protein
MADQKQVLTLEDLRKLIADEVAAIAVQSPARLHIHVHVDEKNMYAVKSDLLGWRSAYLTERLLERLVDGYRLEVITIQNENPE